VSDEQLTTPEFHALIALMIAAREVTNAELKLIAGVELSGAPRRRLNELKLVTSTKAGRSFRHELTDPGWVRAQEELSAPRPVRAGGAAGVLGGMLTALGRYTRDSGTRLSEIFTPDVEQAIRTAYWRLADRSAAPVRLSAIRAHLADISGQIDAELIRMAELPDVYLRGEVNQQHLTEEDRAAAIRLGGDDRHNLQIEAQQIEAR
jgi:hypothetical protein